MRRTENVKAIMSQGKRYNVNKRKELKMVKDHGALKKGTTHVIRGKLADSMVKKGIAIDTKESKVLIETKEEKFLGSNITIKNLEMVLSGYSEDELLEIIKLDTRVTAKKLATEELRKRED